MTGVRASRLPYPVRPIQDILSRAARELPGKVAVIDGDRRFTYRELVDYSSRFAAALAVLGVVKGDRIGIMAPNCTEFEIAFFGIVRAGAIATTLNSAYQQREIAHQINDSGAKTLIVHEALQGVAEEARDATSGLPSLLRRTRNPSGVCWRTPRPGRPRSRSTPRKTWQPCPTPAAPPGCPRGSC